MNSNNLSQNSNWPTIGMILIMSPRKAFTLKQPKIKSL